MLIRLSKNAFVRQYGNFTYVIERVDGKDRIYSDAEVFFRWITRTARSVDEVCHAITCVYEEKYKAAVKADFHELIATLKKEHIIVCGENESELESEDRSFSYNVENPRTLNSGSKKTEEDVIIDRAIDDYMRENPVAFNLQIDITEACTERCIHCYMPEYQNVQLPLSTLKKVVDEFAAQGGIQLSLSGGECMLHDSFREIVDYARERDLMVSILSNLTLCDSDMVEYLATKDVFVQVSLYSMRPEVHDEITQRRGSFEKTRRAIELLHKADVPCLISCPTMKQNFSDYLAVLEFARSLKMDAQTDFIIMGKKNCDVSNLSCRLNLEQTRAVIEDVVYRSLPVNNEYFSIDKCALMTSDEEWGEKPVCGAGAALICLDARGAYHPCPSLGGIVLGNCYANTLEWVLKESPETNRIRNIKGCDFVKCKNCKDRNYCTVCMSRNYNETGNIFTPANHFCEVAKINHRVVDDFQRGQKS